MRQFVRKVVLLGLMVLVTSGAIIGLGPTDEYISVVPDKHRILRSTRSPRIIFVGGSNIALGVDSQLVQEKLGLPVVNMGLIVSFGLRYMLEEIKPYIGLNDVIVIVPEHELFYHLLNGSERLIEVLEVYPAALRFIKSPQEYLAALRGVPELAQRRFKRIQRRIRWGKGGSEPCIYCRKAFDQNGDHVGHLTRKSWDVSKDPLFFTGKDGSFDNDAIDILNRFNSYARGRGSIAFLVFPYIPHAQYRDNQRQIDLVYDRFKTSLEMSILTSPMESTLPGEYFFDHPYHLNAEGRRIRTEKLVVTLAAALNLRVAGR